MSNFDVGSAAGMAGLALVVVIILSVVFYLLPTIVVLNNKHHSNKAGVVIVNLFLGWSFLGWLISLVWAFQKSIPAQVQVAVNANHNSYSQPSPQPVPQPVLQASALPERQSQPQPQLQPAPSSPKMLPAEKWQGFLYQNGALLKQFSVSNSPMVIGRSADADVRIDDSNVSGRHWQVQASDNGVELKDLNSTNGTWKHGQVRTEWDLAQEGDWYQVGVVQLGFRRV